MTGTLNSGVSSDGVASGEGSDSQRPLISVDEVTKLFEIKGATHKTVQALDGVSLEIARGEIVGIAGESGSGKSTLGRLMTELVEPSSGQIFFDGKELTSLHGSTNIRQQVQMVFQDPEGSLNPRKTIGAILDQPLRLHTVLDKDQRRERVVDLLERVRLAPAEQYLDKYPHQLSGGAKQRVGIARAIAVNPRLIVADESVAALDVSTRGAILTLLKSLHSELGFSMVFISHDLHVLEVMCSRIGVMYLGNLVEVGTTEEIFKTPRHPYTKALISLESSADPTIARERKKITLKGELPSASNPPSGCRFHPRCPRATAQCSVEKPKRSILDDAQSVACHNPYPVSTESDEDADSPSTPTTDSTSAGPPGPAASEEQRDSEGSRSRQLLVTVGKRLLAACGSVAFIVAALFTLPYLAPGDPLTYRFQSGATLSAEQMATMRQELGLDQPIYAQFFDYIRGLLTGDLGDSFSLGGTPVLTVILERLPATLILMVPAIIIGVLLGTFLGTISARRPGTLADTLTRTGALAGYSIPQFWLGILLIQFLAVDIPIFPAGGYPDARDYDGPVAYFYAMVSYATLPIFVLALFYIAMFARYGRTSLLEQTTENYVVTARAKGLSEGLAFRRHVLRNGTLPLITMLGVAVASLFTGAVVIETVFNWPGIGLLTYNAILARDYPLIQGLFLVSAVTVVFANLLVDFLQAWLDPRIRRAA